MSMLVSLQDYLQSNGINYKHVVFGAVGASAIFEIFVRCGSFPAPQAIGSGRNEDGGRWKRCEALCATADSQNALKRRLGPLNFISSLGQTESTRVREKVRTDRTQRADPLYPLQRPPTPLLEPPPPPSAPFRSPPLPRLIHLR